MPSFIIFSLLICCICMNVKCEISMVNRPRKTFFHPAETPLPPLLFLLFSRCNGANRFSQPSFSISLHISLGGCHDCIKARSQGAKGQRHAHCFVIGLCGCGSTLCVCQQSKVKLLVIAVYREDCRLLKRCPYATDDLENAVEILKDKNI